jgi:hypothetical protein
MENLNKIENGFSQSKEYNKLMINKDEMLKQYLSLDEDKLCIADMILWFWGYMAVDNELTGKKELQKRTT